MLYINQLDFVRVDSHWCIYTEWKAKFWVVRYSIEYHNAWKYFIHDVESDGLKWNNTMMIDVKRDQKLPKIEDSRLRRPHIEDRGWWIAKKLFKTLSCINKNLRKSLIKGDCRSKTFSLPYTRIKFSSDTVIACKQHEKHVFALTH